MVVLFSLGSSLLYIGLGGAQQPPMPYLSPKEGPGTNLSEINAKTRILEGFRRPRRPVQSGGTGGYRGPRPYRLSSKLLEFSRACSVLSILAVSYSYELRFRCSSARWNRMHESYNIMVLDFHFEMIEKSHFSNPSYG